MRLILRMAHGFESAQKVIGVDFKRTSHAKGSPQLWVFQDNTGSWHRGYMHYAHSCIRWHRTNYQDVLNDQTFIKLDVEYN